MIQPHVSENSHDGFRLHSRLRGLSKWPIFLALFLSLSACSGSGFETFKKVWRHEIVQNRNIRPNLQVVLKSVPRNLMVAPQDVPVWLWDKPGGMSNRAMRVKKLPSGTAGRVVEYEPEDGNRLGWAEAGYHNPGRQPIRWVRVVTFKGSGWVRAEFIDPK